MLHSEEITTEIAVDITGLFRRYQKPILLYHNLAHTKNVVARANEIAANYLLNETELFIVTAAAWFHDCGHLFGPAAGHEERSALIMRNYFAEKKVEENILYDIEQCILATKLPYNPKSLSAQIVCDADSYHLGTDEFIFTNELVKKEFQLRNNYLPSDWNESTLSLLIHHTFFTTYCRTLLEPGKQKNIELIREKTRSVFNPVKNIIKCAVIFLALLLTTKTGSAQSFNIYRSYDAVMVNSDSSMQIRLRHVTIILPGNYNVLNVKLNFPFPLIDHEPEDAMFSQNLLFDLKININFNQIQQELTSAKTFTTHSFLTLNNITRTVKVEYMPLPVGPDMNGNFKINMNIFLNPAEFNLGGSNNNSQFIIIINNAVVNRI